jgi:hypothetical protein
VEFEEGVTVAGGAGNGESLVEGPAGETGLAGAFGEMEADVAAGEVVAAAALVFGVRGSKIAPP